MKNVLVVDDNPIVRRHLRGLLERDGCIVAEATDGDLALETLKQRHFDVMFLDLHMPRLDGAGVLAALGDKRKQLPVVLITSSESSAEIVSAFKLGARDYLLKPFREPQVRRAMQQATGLDYTTIARTRSDVALFDRDEGLAQVMRGLVATGDNLEHVEAMQGVPECARRPHQVVLVGNLDARDAAAEEEEAEALGDIVSSTDPAAALIRLLPNTSVPLPEITVFHASVGRDDEAGLKKVFRAIRSGAVLSSGRQVRALPYEGPADLCHLYWWTLRHSIEAALVRVFALGGSNAILELSLAPDDQEKLHELIDWVLEFSAARMVETQIVRDPVRNLTVPTTGIGPVPMPTPAPQAVTPVPGPGPASVVRAPVVADENATRVQTVPVNVLMEGPATRLAPAVLPFVAAFAPPAIAPVAAAVAVAPVAVVPETCLTPAPGPGIVIPGFEFSSMVGEGGMSRVYRATQKSLRRQVCIKVMREEFAKDPSLAERFHDEGIALAALRHPNIVSVLDVGRSDDGQLYMVMEYVDGGDLRSMLARVEKVPVRETVTLVSQLLGGLAEAHASGVIHRDLKPSNVLLTTLKDGSSLVKLVDFGIAKLIEGMRLRSGATRQGTVVGTPGYMAPEQLLGMEVVAATDLYAVGVILFELLTGRRPFVARDEFELAQLTMMTPVPHLNQILGDGIPPALDELIIALLAKNPKDRPQSAADVRVRLNAVTLPVAA